MMACVPILTGFGEHGARTLDSVISRNSIGLDAGISKSQIRNIIGNGEQARRRMSSVLENAKKCVWIQGNSYVLSSQPTATLALYDTGYKQSRIDVKVLVIDVDGEQALWRAFREELLVNPAQTFQGFTSSNLKHSHLATHRRETIRRLKELVAISLANDQSPSVELRSYSTAPAYFLLRVDDCIFVEQYHYGHRQDAAGNPEILGTDMPLVEYSKKMTSLFDGESGDIGPSFDLLVNSFDFVFAHSNPIDL